MLLAPAATAALFSRRVGSMMAWASLIGAFSVYGGLLASYWLDIAAGASITLVSSLIFFLALGATRISLKRKAGPSPAASAASAQPMAEPMAEPMVTVRSGANAKLSGESHD
jgi:hypothetical protein